jgi:hypothetical protein
MNDRVMETKQGSACLYGGTKSACHNTTLHDGRKEMCTPQHKKCARHIKKCACHNTRNVYATTQRCMMGEKNTLLTRGAYVMTLGDGDTAGEVNGVCIA